MSIPLIHTTDLFRPYNDPDDHWDLACLYALALAGDIELRAIVIDYPPIDEEKDAPDPDALALAQMNYLTGMNVPFSVGSSVAFAPKVSSPTESAVHERTAVRMIIDVLQKSSSPVAITIGGSCREVARAAMQAPQLFREKCAGIYVNAGTGTREGNTADELEYNVSLDPVAFASLFEIPCPIYWLPCFETITNQRKVSEFGSWYDFLQADILFHLKEKPRNYLLYALARFEHSDWLQYLYGGLDDETMFEESQKRRNMWCTAGFFHAAGKCVTASGKIQPRDPAYENEVFSFDPIEIQCTAGGMTSWSPSTRATNRFILHVRDVENYADAITAAMKKLLMTLP